jgi:nitrile hydratase
VKPHFQVGDRVRVRVAYPHGHCRTPHYCRGKAGTVERICGEFRTPEALAYGRDGLPKAPLYRIRFPQSVMWPDYAGPKDDTIDIEIYEHWLEPA